MRNFALRDKDGNEIGVFTGKAAKASCFEGSKSWAHGYQASRNEEPKRSMYSLERENR